MNKLVSPLTPPTLQKSDTHVHWGNLISSSLGLVAANFYQQAARPLVILTNDIKHQEQVRYELMAYDPKLKSQIHVLADWETLPYDRFSAHQDIISTRLTTLYRLLHEPTPIVLCSLPTAMHFLIPPDFLLQNTLVLKIGDRLNLQSHTTTLSEYGYRRVNEVTEHGEFAVRGSIIDVFPMGHNHPYRIELFDDEIESIREFHISDQRSTNQQQAINILPAYEHPITEAAITQFRHNWRNTFSGNPNECPIYQQISQGQSAQGIEYYLPLFFKEMLTLFSYLPANSVILHQHDLLASAQTFWHETKHRYEQLRYDVSHPLLEPKQLFLQPEAFFHQLKPFQQIITHQERITQKPGHYNFAIERLPDLHINRRSQQPLQQLENFLNTTENNVLFCTETTGRREALLELLKSIKVKPSIIDGWQHFTAQPVRFAIMIAPLTAGFSLTQDHLSLITETELFGEQVQQRRLRQQRVTDPTTIIRSLQELNIGDPIVHHDHGVGRYLGLKIIHSGGVEGEYLTLEYADQARIYVPIASLHLISRYTGADRDHAPLNKLGTQQWQKIKKKSAEEIRDTAAELLAIHTQREAETGFAFKLPEKDYLLFEQSFAFETTPDQEQAIQTVIHDMQRERAMDRLVCGDVGFGKTEVAMRAAFIAAMNSKQVIVLVPTTLLAQQHYQSFSDRFSDWPIKIAGISRFNSSAEQKKIIAGLANGEIDIVIGTHKLLDKQIKYKDLGLLIVDEEHRFGVRHKEQIKALRAHIDILTLTATPIPRTLNMSMNGIRDLSIIATPPAKRLAIKTFVIQENLDMIKEAILRETMRGGQIYYLHNEVATIHATAERLQKLLPHVRIGVAHGQMRESELERVMSDFYHQRFNILLCTTIVESGIDIPTANTMIIDRADKFGLAQLHQLRGRVGRSHHQAYAYLIAPPPAALTNDAQSRLDAIAQLEELGSGFNLATHDLEIRGAGQILGDKQSGHMHAIGFSLYMEMLNEAVNALKTGTTPNFDQHLNPEIEIELPWSTLFPDHYIHDINTRLNFYKRLANSENTTEIDDITAELIDRYGLLPDASKNLIALHQIRLLAKPLGINKITSSPEFLYVKFSNQPHINSLKLLELVQKHSNHYQLQGPDRLRYRYRGKDVTAKLDEFKQLLGHLAS